MKYIVSYSLHCLHSYISKKKKKDKKKRTLTGIDTAVQYLENNILRSFHLLSGLI